MFTSFFMPYFASQDPQTQLLDAIKKSNYKLVKQNITLVKNLDSIRDVLGRTILHLALKYGNYNIVSCVLDNLKAAGQDKLDVILNTSDNNAKTPLHTAARYADFQTASLLLQTMGSKAHATALKINHKKGLLPIEMVEKNPNKTSKLKKLWEDLTIERIPQKLDEAILYDDILKNIPVQYLTSDTRKDVELACKAINLVRKKITKSFTNPATNCFSEPEYRAIVSDLSDVRDEIHSKNKKIDPTLDEDSQYLKKLDNIDSVVSSHSNANCFEYAHLSVKELYKLGYQGPLEVFTIKKKGDHTFAVMGRDLSSSTTDFTKWGPKCFVVDAWKGDIFPANEIPNRLWNYRGYPNPFFQTASLVMPFDKNFNYLERCQLFNPKRNPAAAQSSQPSAQKRLGGP